MTIENKMGLPVSDQSEETMKASNLNWSIYLPIGISLVLLMMMFSPIFKAWYSNWTQDESYYSHGPLVPFISIFLLWLKRKELAEVQIRPSAAGYAGLIPLLVAVGLVLLAGSKIVGGLVFPLIIASMVVILFGWRMLRVATFPVGFLFFMCVLPGFILVKLSFKIQIWSTQIATLLLKPLFLVGMPLHATHTGAMISVNFIGKDPMYAGDVIRVLVGAPCSGFRMLISLLALATLFAYLREGPRWGKVGLVAFTGPLSLIVNSLRIAMIAIVGGVWGQERMQAFHDYSGYIVLVLAFVILWFTSRLFKCEKFNSMLMP